MTSPDQDLWTQPKWRAEDLGKPLPDSPHANSVCLPTWQDVVDYEEKKPRVIERLQAGYPRFVVPPPCARFFEVCRQKLARPGELCHAYPSERSARRCAELIQRWSGEKARVEPWPGSPVHVVVFPEKAFEWALKYWRHTGDGISSRRAEAMLNGTPPVDAADARASVRQRIGELAGASAEDVYLFRSGMAGIYALHRTLARMRPGVRSAQFGFPYVDTLKIQQDFGTPSAFFPMGDARSVDDLRRALDRGAISGLFCEFPSNPRLVSPDLNALSELSRRCEFPVIVDDTIATWANVRLFPTADVLVTSLTKYFTGRGDLMAGSVVLNRASPFYLQLREALDAEYEDCIWGQSTELVDRNSVDFVSRVRRCSETAEKICDWLHERPEVQSVYYPKFHARDCYDAFRREDGGYGGLFSIVLRNPAATSARFYNHLEFCKGPNLGTTFSLCCPFTMLAHYSELGWAEECGVSRYLLRFSIGLEEPEDLMARLARAFDLAE